MEETKVISDEQAMEFVKHFAEMGTLREMKGISDAQLEAIYATGVNFYKAGNFADAEKIFKFLTMFEHTSSRYWTSLGSVQQAQKKFEEAIKCYQLGAFLDLHNPKPMYYAAECFFLTGDKVNAAMALASLEKCAPKDTENGRKYLAKGESLKKMIEAK